VSNFQILTILCAMGAMFAGQTTILVLYINAKINPLQKQMDFVVRYIIEHSEKIAALEERTGGPTKKSST
jgi:hypothetical protein